MESLIQRHISIIHLAEQHISMDLTEGIREVLLMEAFTGPVFNLNMSEKPANLQGGSAIEIICNWYIENIVKDISGAGVIFVPAHNCFKSSQHISGYLAESFTSLSELKALTRIFGGYGFDKMDRITGEHVAALLNCIDTSLRVNREALEAIAGCLSSGDRIEREANLKMILDMETLIDFCIQAGQAIAFRRMLVEAAAEVLEEKAPLIVSLLSGVGKQLPNEIPEKGEIKQLRKVANSVGVVAEHDMEWMHAIMEEAGPSGDSSWSLLPYLFAALMTSNIWSTTNYNVTTGGFNNNLHCLARYIFIC